MTWALHRGGLARPPAQDLLYHKGEASSPRPRGPIQNLSTQVRPTGAMEGARSTATSTSPSWDGATSLSPGGPGAGRRAPLRPPQGSLVILPEEEQPAGRGINCEPPAFPKGGR